MANQPCHGKREMRVGTPVEDDATPASKVLGDEDLLGEILHRVDSPTTLVRAALASKRWLRRASDGTFLRRFRELHPPRLLGFFVTGDGVVRTEFVPMPPDTELSPALRRASTVFDALPPYSSSVWDSQNGRVLFDFSETWSSLGPPRRFAVQDTLRHPGGAMTELPPPPPNLTERFHGMLLPDDDRDDATCYRVDVHHVGRSVSAEVTVLRHGAWSVLCSASAVLAMAPERIPMITLLAGGRVYTVAVAGFIVGLNLATADLFAVDLPEGVTYEYFGNLVPSRGDDSLLYLFHVKPGDRDELSVWLRRMDDVDHGEWMLRDTISVKEACRDVIKKHGSEQSNGDPDGTYFSPNVVGVGDNAEFVFLELGNSGVVVYLHIGSRRAEKVYQRRLENDELILVHPFHMVWPPVFPALASDESRHG